MRALAALVMVWAGFVVPWVVAPWVIAEGAEAATSSPPSFVSGSVAAEKTRFAIADGAVRVIYVEGKGWWRRNAEPERYELRAGELLPGDVWVMTGADGQAVLRFPGGDWVALEPGSRLFVPWPAAALNAGEKELTGDSLASDVKRVRRELGEVWISIVRRVGRLFRFEVDTPSAVAAVRG